MQDDKGADPVIEQVPNLLDKIDAQIAAQGNDNGGNPPGGDDIPLSGGDDVPLFVPQAEKDIFNKVDQALGNSGKTEEELERERIIAEGGTPPPPATDTIIPMVFNSLKKVFGDDYVAPEGVTAENLHEKLIEETHRVYVDALPAEVKEFYSHIKNGGTKETFVQKSNDDIDINKIPTEDLLIASLSEDLMGEDNPDAMTEQEVIDYVKSMDPVQKKIMGKNIREKFVAEKEQRMQAQQMEQEKLFKQRIEDKNKENVQLVTKIVDKFKNVKDIYGMPVNQNEIQEFGKEFEQLILRDEKGMSPATKMINDDESFFQLMFLAKRAGYTKEFLREARNQEIDKLKDKLPNQAKHFNQKQTNKPGGIDYDKLAAPAID